MFSTMIRISHILPIMSFPLLAAMIPAHAQDGTGKISFEKQVKPILESACIRCHDEDEAEGELIMDTLANALIGGENGPAIVPEKPEESPLYVSTTLPEDDDMSMPPKGQFLAQSQIDVIGNWISEGAEWPESIKLEKQPRMMFVRDIQPILEEHCVACHKAGKAEGDFDMTTREMAFTSGENAPSIIPFEPEKSAIYFLTTLDKDDDDLMPPAKKGGPLEKSITEKLRLWVLQGAPWPEGIELKQQVKVDGNTSPDSLELVQKIHAFITETAKDSQTDEMANYAATVPQTGAPFNMVAIKGGEFTIGSPDSEPNRKDDEGPQVKVKIAPFWMGKHEVTWDEYNPFMVTQVDRYKDGSRKDYDQATGNIVDAVSQPTTPYMEMSFGMGTRGYPAISMTQHAANKYCQWLSAQTGHFYRLPTEAEWEYACRAGTTTAYSFGDDPANIGDYAVYYDNSISDDTGENQYMKVGTKKPNPWGLYDMHGNVSEWCLDAYIPDSYATLNSIEGLAWQRPKSLYPRVVRGGNWNSDPEAMRSAIRIASSASWKRQDPQLPKSIWYHTDARWLGFRIVRPKEIPSAEEMYEIWNMGRGTE